MRGRLAGRGGRRSGSRAGRRDSCWAGRRRPRRRCAGSQSQRGRRGAASGGRGRGGCWWCGRGLLSARGRRGWLPGRRGRRPAPLCGRGGRGGRGTRRRTRTRAERATSLAGPWRGREWWKERGIRKENAGRQEERDRRGTFRHQIRHGIWTEPRTDHRTSRCTVFM